MNKVARFWTSTLMVVRFGRKIHTLYVKHSNCTLLCLSSPKAAAKQTLSGNFTQLFSFRNRISLQPHLHSALQNSSKLPTDLETIIGMGFYLSNVDFGTL